MKLPYGWVSAERGWYEAEFGPREGAVVHHLREGWYAWRKEDHEDNPLGIFKTAREAFAALGVKVEEGK